MTVHVLLVDADDLLRRSLAAQLTGQGFTVAEAATGAAARERLAAAQIVVIDAKLPDMPVVELCDSLRRQGHRHAIIVLGTDTAIAAAARDGRINGCVAKPFRLAVLVQRLNDHARELSADQPVSIGGFRFHPSARQMVDGDGRLVRLTEKEAAILTYLHRAGSRVVPREELLGEVWGYADAVSTHTVETHIYRLRRKLDNGGDPLLLTEPGGYRLA